MTPDRLAVFAIALGTVLFGAAIAGRHIINPWWTNAAAAVVTIAASWAALRFRLRRLFAFRANTALIAVGLGVLMVTATHAGFRIAVEIFPDLGHEVARLYGDINDTTPGVVFAVPLIAMIATAEEVLWRGIAIELCQHRFSRAFTAMVAIALYALPQLIGGAWILVAAAVVVGTVFTVQRLITGGIVEPLITHAVWSVSIFSLVPVI
ncbi:MAG: CPBP family glutamic-type intramembrane protease [Proteobacteria bacterium]|nr:CPBP family glutamic-type intramembrane protease [Pseudomonadota bacterium]